MARRRPDPVIAALRVRRRALGLTVAETARALGYSPRAVESWEGGHKRPPLEVLHRYAELVEARIELVGLTPLPLVGADADELNGLRVYRRSPEKVLALTASGLTAEQIAGRLGCSGRTVQRIQAQANGSV